MFGRVLNMPRVLHKAGFWICLYFWICQNSENTRVLNMLGLWIYQCSDCASGSSCQGSEYSSLMQVSAYAWIPLNNSRYVWLCMNISGMPEYAGICVSMSKSAWVAFGLHLPIEICSLLDRVVNYFSVYTKLEIIVWGT